MSKAVRRCRILIGAKFGTTNMARPSARISASITNPVVSKQAPRTGISSHKSDFCKFFGKFEANPEEAKIASFKRIRKHMQRHGFLFEEIKCGQNLKNLFNGKEKVGMKEVAKLLSRHI
ncbi:hypothetical protein GIB67_026195 [Kingdonia uniflora]|uniref:DM2 domain-containing protein n=1 Tax=Kingdonia uniflora TaxID=39325 RepID=A0A7J7NA66_9MAGN|nr:hypothetical protein GIB67_026195 [Kingdonia uniflora]